MSDGSPVRDDATASDDARPMWFSTPAGRVFAWYHAPRTPARTMAVLMCDTFGSDRMTMHLTHRYLAIELAARGFATLRFDYPGTGDAEGTARRDVRIAKWLDSLDAAANRLRELSGASQLGLFATRLGATLAHRLAERSDVVAMSLLAPFLTGRSLVRESKGFMATQQANPSGRRPPDWQADDQEAYGFLLGAEMIADLGKLDMSATPCAARHVQIITRASNTPERKLVDKYRGDGVDVTFVDRPLVDVTEGGLPGPISPTFLQTVGTWFEERFPDTETRPAIATTAEFDTSIETTEAGQRIRESILHFGDDDALVGILTEPGHAPANAGPYVVLVNGGNNHRSGINRNYTEWARAWAARGATVLRFDIRGLGDSPPRDENEANALYLDHTRQDVVDAISLLQRRAGADKVALVGLCAGAYQSLQTALVDDRVGTLVLLDPLRFHDVPNGDDSAKVAQLGSLSRLLSGEVSLSRALRAGARALAQVPARLRAQPVSETARRFTTVMRRGVAMHLLFAEGTGSIETFERATVGDRESLEKSGRLTTEIIPDADHIFSPLWSQGYLREKVWELMTSSRR